MSEEFGFYHPAVGYWQTTSEPSANILETYPEGTIPYPLKPGAHYVPKDGGWVYVEPVAEPMPEMVTVVYPVHLWERLSGEGEADKVGAVMAQQDFRTRQIFASASSYRSDHELWPLLQQIATTLFGEARAAQILAPSELVPAG